MSFKVLKSALLFALLIFTSGSKFLHTVGSDSLFSVQEKTVSPNEIKSERLYFETEYPEQSDAAIREHLVEQFPIISEKDIQKILFSKTITPSVNVNNDSLNNESAGQMYKVSFTVPENFLVDSTKILWELNIPEFNSRIYQLHKGQEIYIDTWPNVIGTIKDKTYTGNFQAYRIRNWPWYKDPDPSKASLPPVKPGPGNPLGLFVVHYDENSLRYFHGTNKPHLLNNKMRNLSHGCVRNDNDNISRMKEFIIKKIVKSEDLSSWLGSKKTLIYDFAESDKFPVRIIYKTYDVNTDENGNYIILFSDIYKYAGSGKINTTLNDEALITLSYRENIISDYRKKFGKDIPDEALEIMTDYLINSGKEYEKYYIDDLKEKFMVRN